MFSVFFMKGLSQAARIWLVSGHGAVGHRLRLRLSGYLLPMDELSYLPTKVASKSLRPFVDRPSIANMLRAALKWRVHGAALLRLHVVVLPALFLPCRLSFVVVQRHGKPFRQ